MSHRTCSTIATTTTAAAQRNQSGGATFLYQEGGHTGAGLCDRAGGEDKLGGHTMPQRRGTAYSENGLRDKFDLVGILVQCVGISVIYFRPPFDAVF